MSFSLSLPGAQLRFAASAILSTLAVGPLVALANDESLARYTPAEVGLFVEAVNAEDLLLPLTDAQVWLTLADLAGQPARTDDTILWRERIQQTIGMSPDEAIRALLSRRAAFVGHAPGRSQDGVVLCTPPDTITVSDLIARWTPATRFQHPRAAGFLLKYNVGLTLIDGHTLCFGDSGPGGRLLSRVEDCVESRVVPLSADPIFVSLIARVPETPDGLLFIRLPRPPTSRPASAFDVTASQPHATSASTDSLSNATLAAPASSPAVSSASLPSVARAPASRSASDIGDALRRDGGFGGDAGAILVALHREQQHLHFSAVSDAPPRSSPRVDLNLAAQAESLPADTLVGWCGEVDYVRLLASAERLPPKNIFRVILNSQRQGRGVRRLIDALGRSASVTVGAVSPSMRREDAPRLPAIGLALAAIDPDDARRGWDELVNMARAAYNLLALTPNVDLPKLLEVRDVEVAGRAARSLDLTPLSARFDSLNAVGQVELCWLVDRDALLVSTHRDWLAALLRARNREIPDMSDVLGVTQHAVSPRASFVLTVKSGGLSELCFDWLAFLERHAPDAMRESWWRDRQPVGSEPRLGIDGREDGAARRLVVESVDPRGWASGIVSPRDIIIGCDGRRFATTQPVLEFRNAVAQRPNAQWIDVILIRDGATIARRLPLPFVNPVELLRRVGALGRIARSVVVHDDTSADGLPRGFMTVELRSRSDATTQPTSARPTFTGSPSSEPSSQPG